jgi:hypothetical protein
MERLAVMSRDKRLKDMRRHTLAGQKSAFVLCWAAMKTVSPLAQRRTMLAVSKLATSTQNQDNEALLQTQSP